MSLRVSLLALAALALTGCDRPVQKPKTPASAPVSTAAASRDCCCKVCPVDAVPIAQTPSDDVAAVGDTRSTRRSNTAGERTVARSVVRHAPKPQVRQQRTYSYAGGYKPSSSARSSSGSARRDYAVSGRSETLAGGTYARRDQRYGGFEGYGERERAESSYAQRSDRGYAQRDAHRYEDRRYDDSSARRSEQRYSERSAGSYGAERRAYEDQQRRYQRAEAGYGGRYGASGRVASGVSVSVEESESFSERRRYSESSSSYGSRGGVVSGASYGHSTALYYEDRDGRVRRGGPAGTDRAGYLTWPGKVEN